MTCDGPTFGAPDAARGAVDWPSFDGSLSTDERRIGAAADDFGHLVTRRPVAVLEAATVNDVMRIVRHARAMGVRLAPRGTGHTVYGHSQIEGGIVVDLRGLDQMHSLAPGAATVGAGMSWRTIVERSLPIGTAPPVLTDFLDLSVGGTLSVGGVSGTSFRCGAQIDNVSELVVVTGAGDIVTCSQREERQLFDAVLGGFGQVGIIVAATIGLSPAADPVEVLRLPYRDLAAMAADLRLLASQERFEYLLGIITPSETGEWMLSIEAAIGRSHPPAAVSALLDGLSFRKSDQRSELRSASVI